MLSQRFRNTIERVFDADTTADTRALDPLRDLAWLIPDPKDRDEYIRFVFTGPLDSAINGSHATWTASRAVANLAHLDLMRPETQKIINECIDALDCAYVIDEATWASIKKALESRSRDSATDLLNHKLRTHWVAMVHALYYIWHDAPESRAEFIAAMAQVIKLKPDDSLATFTFFIAMYEPGMTYALLHLIFLFAEMLVRKHIRAATHSQGVPAAPAISSVCKSSMRKGGNIGPKLPIETVCKLTVAQLKELCEKHHVPIPYRPRKDECIAALTK